MNIKRLAEIAILLFFLIIGCSGTSGKLKTQPESVSKVTLQEMIDNWSDYDIRYRKVALVFAPKNDDRKILLGGNRGWWWDIIGDQETWTKFVKANITRQGDFRPAGAKYSMTGVREIWGPDNQLYGFIIHQQKDRVDTKLVDENTLRLWYYLTRREGL